MWQQLANADGQTTVDAREYVAQVGPGSVPLSFADCTRPCLRTLGVQPLPASYTVHLAHQGLAARCGNPQGGLGPRISVIYLRARYPWRRAWRWRQYELRTKLRSAAVLIVLTA